MASCSFHATLNAAVVSQGSAGLVLDGNVIHNTVGGAISLDLATEAAVVRNNFIVGSTRRDRFNSHPDGGQFNVVWRPARTHAP